MSDFEKVYSIKFDTDKAFKSLDKLEDALKRIEKSGVFFQMKAISKVLLEIDRNALQASKTIKNRLGKEAQRDLKALGKSGEKASHGVDKIGKSAKMADLSLSTMGRNMNRYVLAPLAALSGLSIKAALDINKGMASVSTLVDKTPEQLQVMKREAQDTMIAMGKGTQDVTDGLYQVISALGESEQNMAQLQQTTRAAVAGLSDTKSSVEMLTAVAKAYNDTSAESIGRTSDLAFQTVKLGVTTFPELAASIGKVAPLAAQFNTSQEELFGTMATLTGVTGNTSEVVTQLASVYAAFMNPSEEMTKALKRINKEHKDMDYNSVQSMVKTEGLARAIELMGKEAGGSEQKLFKMFRRKEALLAILPLISTQSENYSKKLAAMRDAAGATDEAFRRQTEGINKQGFELEQTKQRIIVFGQRIGDRFLPMLGRAVEWGNKMLDWVDRLDDDSIDAAISVGKIITQFVLMTNALRGINAVGTGVLSFLNIANSGFGTFSGQVGTAAGKVDIFTRSLSGLQKGVGILGALALGYTIGELIEKGFIAPEIKRRQKKIVESENRAVSSFKNASELSDKELETRIKKSKSEVKEIDKSVKTKTTTGQSLMIGAGSMYAPAQTAVAAEDVLLGVEQDKDKARRRKALVEEQQALENERARRAAVAEYGLSEGMQRGGGGFDWNAPQQDKSPVNINNTYNFSGGVDERKMKQLIKKQNKRNTMEIQQLIDSL